MVALLGFSDMKGDSPGLGWEVCNSSNFDTAEPKHLVIAHGCVHSRAFRDSLCCDCCQMSETIRSDCHIVTNRYVPHRVLVKHLIDRQVKSVRANYALISVQSED